MNLAESLDALDAAERVYTCHDLATVVNALCSVDNDHASVQNGIGWDGRDSHFGHTLGSTVGKWTPRMYSLAWRMVQRYHKQVLKATGIDVHMLPMEMDVPPKAKVVRSVRAESNGHLRIAIDRDDTDIRAEIKSCKGFRWLPEQVEWDIPSTEDNWTIVAKLLIDNEFTIDSDLRAEIMSYRESAEEKYRRAEMLYALSSSIDPVELDIPGLGAPLRPFQTTAVAYMLEALKDGKGVIDGDEQRVGKTPSSIAVILAKQAFPCLIICGSSIKLQWQADLHKFAPGKTVQVLSGRKPYYSFTSDFYIINWDVLADWYELLASIGIKACIADEFHKIKGGGHVDEATGAFKGVKRAAALIELAKSIPLRIGLSGTPTMNRAKDLVSPLEYIGRLGDLGGYSRVVNYFGNTGAVAKYNAEEGEEILRHPRQIEFNRELRRCCYVRRLRREVRKDLPEIDRQTVTVDIDNRTEYNYAEVYFLRWLQEQEGLAKALKAQRAEVLVRINKLRQLAARGKLAAIKEWLKEYMEETESSDKLIVFAHHRDIQANLADACWSIASTGESYGTFKVARIEAGMKDFDRETVKRDFQRDPKTRVIVVTLLGGSEGLTLSAASTVITAEFGWNPAVHAQAESRAVDVTTEGAQNRVTSFYVQASGTIDEDMVSLIQSKMAETTAVNNGTNIDEAGEDMIGAVVAGMYARQKQVGR